MTIGRDVLARDVLKRTTILVPEWGGEIIVRELTGREAGPIGRLAMEISKRQDDLEPDKITRWEALTVQSGWINEDGSRVLNGEDVEVLLDTQPYDVIQRIAKEIRQLSGMERSAPPVAPVDAAKKN